MGSELDYRVRELEIKLESLVHCLGHTLSCLKCMLNHDKEMNFKLNHLEAVAFAADKHDPGSPLQ